MDIFEQYIFDELVSEYSKPNMSDDDYEELFIRFSNMSHLAEVKPYICVMKYLGLGTEPDDTALSELMQFDEDNIEIQGLIADLKLINCPNNTEALADLRSCVEDGYTGKYLKDNSNVERAKESVSKKNGFSETTKMTDCDAPHKSMPFESNTSQFKKHNSKPNNVVAEPETKNEETLTKEIVLSLIKKNMNVNSSSSKTLTLPLKYNIIGSFSFQGIKDIDVLNIPRGYAEIESNAFSWAVIHQVRIPDSVAIFGKNAFKGFTGVIECSSSSFAFKYAKKNNIRTLVTLVK